MNRSTSINLSVERRSVVLRQRITGPDWGRSGERYDLGLVYLSWLVDPLGFVIRNLDG